jgi:hypothetical protein
MCGYSGVTTATLTRSGGFPGPVTVSVSGLPDGVDAFLLPSELTGAATTTTITIVAEETVVPGSYTVTVLAASSIGEATTTYRLVLVEPPDFHISVEPSAMTVERGEGATTTVHITRSGGFTGEVALSLENSGGSITATFAPATVAGATSTATILVASTLPMGSYTVTVTGAAAGLPTRTATIALTVTGVSTEWYLVAAPTELTVARGSHGQTDVSVVTDAEILGFAGYSLVDPPAGIYAWFDYHYDWGYPATATIFVPSTVAAGRYMLTLGAVVSGTPTKTVAIALTVIDP